jgi:lipopolysaccharide export LptBFGC system permease protein LptF
MKNIRICLILLISLFLAQSCTIQKRIDKKGFSLDWNSKNKNSELGRLNKLKTDESFNENLVILSEDQNLSIIESENANQLEQTLLDVDYTIDGNTSKKTIQNEQKVVEVDDNNSLTGKILITDAKINNESAPITDKENETNDDVKTSGFAIAALVCGILALFTTLIGSIILATLAVVFGLIAINKISKNPNKFKGKGMAWAGYIIGLVAVLIWTILFALS